MNEAATIVSVVERVHEVMDGYGAPYEILVVDDGSSDNTGQMAFMAGAKVIKHAYNLGNGAAIKTGIRIATGDTLVMMDGDNQHDPQDILLLLDSMDSGSYVMVVGARTKNSQTYWHRNLANAIFNRLASYVCGRKIVDLTSGFRAVNIALARQFLHLLPNTFSYPTTLTLATIRSGYAVKYVPIQTKWRIGESKIKIFRDGIRFLLIILKISTLYSPLKVFTPISVGISGLGIAWYLFTLITYGPHFPPASVIMILSGVLFFLLGLVSEQITQLCYIYSEALSIAKNQPEAELLPDQ